MTFWESAEKVLIDNGNKPLHYREITERAIGAGYIETRGETPQDTMTAVIGEVNRRRIARGEEPLFEVLGKGYYRLAKGKKKGFAASVEQENRAVKERLLEHLREMEPKDFEVLVGQLLTKIGFEDVEVTQFVGDHGIDVMGNLTVGGVSNVQTFIQVKRYAESNRVGGKVVRELRGSLGVQQRGLIITTSDFTRDALTEASLPDRTPVSLLNGQQLVDLLAEHEIGIRRKMVPVLELNVEDLDMATATSTTASSRKKAGLWPLPGGTTKYLKTMTDFLNHILDADPTFDEMAAWIIDKYKNVSSKKAAGGYIRVLKTVGAVVYDGEKIKLTPEAAEYMKDMDEKKAQRLFLDNVAGAEEAYDYLKDGPKTREQVHNHLQDALGVTWESPNQSQWRLYWLQSLGLAEKTKDGYRAG